MRKILLDKVREDFSHTHPEFNTLQSSISSSPPKQTLNGVNGTAMIYSEPPTFHATINNNHTTTSNSSSSTCTINTIVNPFTLPTELQSRMQISPPPLVSSSSLPTVPSNANTPNSVGTMQQNGASLNQQLPPPSIHVSPFNNNNTIANNTTSIVFPPPLLQQQSNNPQVFLINNESINRSSDEEQSNAGNGSTVVQQEKKRRITRRTTNNSTRRRSHSNHSNHSMESNEDAETSEATLDQQSNSGVQSVCCIEGCSKDVSNRLRFSLRCDTEFKPDYVSKFWNNICNYCYFHDLYQWKKLNQQTSTSDSKKKNSTTTTNSRKRANSSLSTNSTTSTKSTKSAKSEDHSSGDGSTNGGQSHDLNSLHINNHTINHHHHANNNTTTGPVVANATSASPYKKVNDAIGKTGKPLKIDTSFTLSNTITTTNNQQHTAIVTTQQRTSYVDPSPVHKEDVNALLDFLSAASQNN